MAARIRREDPIVSPVWNEDAQEWRDEASDITDPQWRGDRCFTATAPDGTKIPVDHSRPVGGGGRIPARDDRLEIITQERLREGCGCDTDYRVASIWRRNSQGEVYDTGETFDYRRFGYMQIGNVLVHPANRAAVKAAHERADHALRGQICIAVLVSVTLLWVWIFGGPGGKNHYQG